MSDSEEADETVERGEADETVERGEIIDEEDDEERADRLEMELAGKKTELNQCRKLLKTTKDKLKTAMKELEVTKGELEAIKKENGSNQANKEVEDSLRKEIDVLKLSRSNENGKLTEQLKGVQDELATAKTAITNYKSRQENLRKWLESAGKAKKLLMDLPDNLGVVSEAKTLLLTLPDNFGNPDDSIVGDSDEDSKSKTDSNSGNKSNTENSNASSSANKRNSDNMPSDDEEEEDVRPKRKKAKTAHQDHRDGEGDNNNNGDKNVLGYTHMIKSCTTNSWAGMLPGMVTPGRIIRSKGNLTKKQTRGMGNKRN